MGIPPVGSDEFKRLSFHDKLEVISIQIFSPDEYNHLIGRVSEGGLQIEYPPLPDIEVMDIHVSFLQNYWAAYSCRFRHQWYMHNSPLDEFGVSYRRMVNVYTFNFPLISFSGVAYRAFMHCKDLLLTCKVVSYLELIIKQSKDHYKILSKNHSASKIVSAAKEEYCNILTIDQMIGYYPIVEEDVLLWFMEDDDLLMHHLGRRRSNRWFFPLMPANLFHAPFHVYTWDFLR